MEYSLIITIITIWGLRLFTSAIGSAVIIAYNIEYVGLFNLPAFKNIQVLKRDTLLVTTSL
jgi:hypothetical protein